MTPDQMKQLAKQAGVQPYEHSQPHRESISFTPAQLAEFVRLVRERVLEEAATAISGTLGYDNYTAMSEASMITRSLKK